MRRDNRGGRGCAALSTASDRQAQMRQRHALATASSNGLVASRACFPTHTSTPLSSPSSISIPLVLTLITYVSLLSLITHSINHHVPSPYMDEPFHYQQTAAYCHQHNYTYYDPKITTFPGLYLASLTVATPLSTLPATAAVDWCGLAVLRWYNVLYAAVAAVLFERIVWHMHPLSSTAHRLLSTLQFALLPLSLVYVPLYYTDTISTAAVLLAFYSAVSQPGVSLHPSHSFFSSPLARLLFSLLALLMRQTNIVWLAFTAGYLLVRRSQPASYSRSSVRYPQGSTEVSGLMSSVWQLVRACDVRLLWPYMVVAVVFAVFLVWNGGSVVLGDKSNHSFTLHLAQLLYFALTIAGLFAIRLVTSGTGTAFLLQAKQRPLPFSAAVAASSVAILFVIRYTTVLHPFLLSDNRHLTFYFTRYVLRLHPLVRYTLTPAYLLALYAINHATCHQPLLLRAGWWLCTALTIALTPLLELRYFVLPAVLLVVLMEGSEGGAPVRTADESVNAVDVEMGSEWWVVVGGVGQVLLFVVLDVVLLYVFIYRPFTWGDGSTARFML